MDTKKRRLTAEPTIIMVYSNNTMDDEDADDGNNLWNVVTKVQNDFVVGFNAVNDNYLASWLLSYCVAGLVKLWFQEFAEASMLEERPRSLELLQQFFLQVENATHIFWKVFPPPSTIMQDFFNASPFTSGGLALLFRYCVFIPLFEEIQFRGFFLLLKKAVAHTFTGATAKDDDCIDDDTNHLQVYPWTLRNLFGGYSPWVLAPSVLFGLIHVNNYTDYFRGLCLDTKESRALAITMSGSVIHLCTTAFISSLTMFWPLCEQYGLGASIGAHMAWNLNEYFQVITLPLRLVNHAVQGLQQRMERHNYEPESAWV